MSLKNPFGPVRINNVANVNAAISLNSSTTTTVSPKNLNRRFFRVDNDGPQKVWIKVQEASVDNVKKGIPLASGGFWEMPVNSICTDEISAIAASDNPDVYFTEY